MRHPLQRNITADKKIDPQIIILYQLLFSFKHDFVYCTRLHNPSINIAILDIQIADIGWIIAPVGLIFIACTAACNKNSIPLSHTFVYFIHERQSSHAKKNIINSQQHYPTHNSSNYIFRVFGYAQQFVNTIHEHRNKNP